MVLNFLSSPPRGLSLEDALKLANEQLRNARKSNEPAKKIQFCKDAKSKLKDAEKIFTTTRIGHPIQDDGIASAYHERAILLDDLGYHEMANQSHKKAKDWGYVHATSQKADSPRSSNITGSVRQLLCPTAALIVAPGIATATHPHILGHDISQPIIPSRTQRAIPAIKDHILEANVDTAVIPQKIFYQDVALPLTEYTLPEDARRITSTAQLAYCLSLSLPPLVAKEGLDETDCKLPQAKVCSPDEQERLKTMATDLIREFIRDEFKKPDAIAEVVCLAAVLDKDDFRKLLQVFVNCIDESVLLELYLLDGLAHLIGNAALGSIDADDLIKILKLLSIKLQDTHQQSTQHIYRLTQTVSRVLDSMVDSQVKGLKREQLHEPLSAYLKGLQANSDPNLIYQAAYAHQVLQYIPDDETILQAALRRTGKAVQSISGVVCAVKALDLNGLIQGLKNIQEGLSDAGKAIVRVNDAYRHAKELGESGQNLFDSLKESLSLDRKRAWYPALRGLDQLLQEGRLVEFEKLIREAPCRQDPAFQFGVCQRLGEIATNSLLDTNIRQCAISFLGEMYKDEATREQQTNVSQQILCILVTLSSSSDDIVAAHVEKELQELGVNQVSLEVKTKEYPISFATILQPQTSLLLDRILKKPDVEAALQQLRKERLKERGGDVYISPRAKVGLASKEDFDLTAKTYEFLDGNKKVLLILGDSGAGKSTFNRALEIELWENYEKNGRIPIFIHLPTIDKPEQDLVDKQLRKANFTEIQIRALKANREFILICDGYDESQQTRNLYISNQLNQAGGWQAQLVISCRTEYTGADYKDQFQPTDRNSDGSLGLMDELIITPFNKNQIQDYIDQYVSLKQSSWESNDYIRALNEIPNLQDLVKNPFLLKMALGVLPTLANTRDNFSTIRITRVVLYDKFVTQWLERSKKRFGEMNLSAIDQEAFRRLSRSGLKIHGIQYMKELATAIYHNQKGNPIVRYSEYSEGNTWKARFFNNINGNNLLLDAIPLVRNGDHYRFIHKSVLEYGLTLAVFDPSIHEESMTSTCTPSRRGSDCSISSFESTTSEEESMTMISRELLESPLGRRNLVGEPSIRQFLVDRVQLHTWFKEQLHTLIELSKTDKTARIAAANSITLLVQAGVQFNGADLRGIQIPGAELSYGMFDSAQLQGADLRKTNLRNMWLREANMSGAQMGGVQFGELPYLQEDAEVRVCAYSPNGGTCAAGLYDGNISLYDTANWSRVQTLKGHNKRVTSLMYSPQGDRIASGSCDSTVRLWDIETGNCVHTLQGHSSWVLSVVYSPKGDQITSGSRDMAVRLWDIETGNCIHTLQGHSSWVQSVVYSPKGDQVASGSSDSTIRLWDVETGNCVHSLQGHSDRVQSVVYSPKGDRIVSGSLDRTVRLWDIEAGNCVHILQGHSSWVQSVVYSPKGDQVASGSHDNTVRLWDVETGNCVHTLQGHTHRVLDVVYSPKGDQIASGSRDMTVLLWDVETGNCVHTLQGHSQKVQSVVYSPKGDQIASGSNDKTVRLWDVETGNFVRTLQGHSDWVRSAVYSPKGDQIASGSRDNTVRLWDAESGNCVHTLQGHSDWVVSVVYSPKGKHIASGSRDNTVRLWDVEAGNCIHTLQGHSHFVQSVVYSPKGDQIASGSWDKTIRLWDVETGNCAHILQGHSNWVLSVVYSPKGDRVASGSDDNTVRLWDVETGNCLHSLQGHSHLVQGVVYSPKRDQIASGSGDKTVRLWDIKTGNCVHTLQGHSDWVQSIVYSSAGDRIASGSRDNTIRLWDTETGSCVHILQGHSDWILSVVYSPKGDQIASGSRDNTIRLWDVETGGCLLPIKGFHGGIESISWRNAFGHPHIVTGSWDRSVRQWRVIKDGDGLKAMLCWSSSHGALTVFGLSLNDVQGLSMVNRRLLHQRGALNSS